MLLVLLAFFYNVLELELELFVLVEVEFELALSHYEAVGELGVLGLELVYLLLELSVESVDLAHVG